MKPMIHRIFHVGLVALGLSLMVSCGDGDKVTGTGTPHFDAGASLAQLGGDEFLGMFPEREMQVLDGGRAFDGGDPPAEIRFNDAHVPNPQRSAPPQTILGGDVGLSM